MNKRCVVLGVTGSIAAYKAAELTSKLKKAGYEVRVILTAGGGEFITPLTLETLSGAPVACSQFSREAPYEVEHIALAKRADVFVVAPATANFIGKSANGIADDLLTTTYLATNAPVIIAPAMNVNMLNHEAVQRNIAILRERGHTIIEPGEGRLACGDSGKGRLADTKDILSAIDAILYRKQDFQGIRLLVTAGPTAEDIDPVRYITNRSSGKMGFAIAEAAAMRGADVKLLAGPVHLPTPNGAARVDVRSSQELYEAVREHFPVCDALIMAAAPADFTVVKEATQKIKKSGEDGLTLQLMQTKDILASLGPEKGHRVVMGFAAETENLEANAKEKLIRKNIDFIAANDVSSQQAGFDVDTNRVVLYDRAGGKEDSGLQSKRDVADWLLDRLLKSCGSSKNVCTGNH